MTKVRLNAQILYLRDESFFHSLFRSLSSRKMAKTQLNDDIIYLEDGELSPSSESDFNFGNLSDDNVEKLIRKKKVYRVRYRRTEPFWLRELEEKQNRENTSNKSTHNDDNRKHENIIDIPDEPEFERLLLNL